MTKADFKIEIDFNNDGDWSDSGEDVTNRVLNHPGIVTARGRDQVRALAPPMAGSCEFALNNASRDYSPDNASGPLYGNLVPGRAVRVRTTAPSAATLWSGHLDDLPQEPFVVGGGRVRAPALGKLAKLKGVLVSSHYYTNVTTSAALTTLFGAAGLAGDEYTMLDTGKTTLTAWWCDEDDAFQMMVRILAAEGPGAAIYESASGVITFHSRHYRLLTARSSTSQATFGNASTEPKHSPPLGYQPNLKGVVNSATVEAAALTVGAYTNVYTYGDPLVPTGPAITVPPGATVTHNVALDNPASGIVTPSWGGGTLLFAEGDPSPAELAAFAVSMSRNSGTRIGITMTNNNARTLSPYYIALAGYPYTSASTPITNSVDASASQAKYGVRSLPTSYAPWPYISEVQALDLANSAVLAYREPRATIGVTVRNANSTRLAQQLAREVSDRITVQETQTGISGDVWIEQIRHEVREGGRFHTTTFGCERVNAAVDDYFIFDVDNFDGETFGF